MKSKSHSAKRFRRRKNPPPLSYMKEQILFYGYQLPKCRENLFYLQTFLDYVDIIESIDVKGYGAVYKIRIYSDFAFLGLKIKKGIYALKVMFKNISDECLNNLVTYSKYGIISKIYSVTRIN